MKILIITVAGSSTRFSKSIGKDVIKCIYNEGEFSKSLLYRMIHQPVQFDKYIIVGGYKYSELREKVESEFVELKDKIDLVYNEQFADYGSGYSLFCGLKRAMEYPFDEIVFAEGDLFVDEFTFVKIVESNKSVVTSNMDPILANKAVAFYYNERGEIKYIYDTGHSALKIDEPFVAIYNSGQIWKFANSVIIRKVFSELSSIEWQGTNLVMVEKYFRCLKSDEYENVQFRKWVNCNTIEDFKCAQNMEEI